MSTSLREAVTAALTEMEAALAAIQNPQEGADVDALERSFDEAETRHAAAVKNLQRSERIAEGRRSLPTPEPVAETAPVVEERAATPAPRVEITREERTYHAGNKYERSYFLDLAMAQVRNDHRAWSRLEQHGREAAVEGETRHARLGGETRDVSTGGPADTGGAGVFVPPTYLVDEYAEYLRAQAITASLIGSKPLPGGTDRLTWPRVTTGASVAAQSAELQNFSETDIVATPVSADVFTLGGIQDISLQALEQSALSQGMDSFIYRELAADKERIKDVYVINGTGSSGQPTGLLGTSSITSVSYTSSTPTVAGLYPKVHDALQGLFSARLAPAECIVMHPRRWAWLCTGLDSSNRPLVVPNAYGPTNAIGAGSVGTMQQGSVGSLAGVPVFLDANIPTTVSSTTDNIIVFRPSDCHLHESTPVMESFRSIGSQSGYVRFRLYSYGLFTAAVRYEGVAKVIGTGLTTPTF